MLQNGQVVQSGTHRELMEKGGSYADLYQYQSALEAYGKPKDHANEISGRKAVAV